MVRPVGGRLEAGTGVRIGWSSAGFVCFTPRRFRGHRPSLEFFGPKYLTEEAFLQKMCADRLRLEQLMLNYGGAIFTLLCILRGETKSVETNIGVGIKVRYYRVLL